MPRVLHLSRRPLNGHPGFLAELQRRQGWESQSCILVPKESGQRPYPCELKATDRAGLKAWASGCEILHLHADMTLNDPLAAWVREQLPARGIIIQQHYRERNALDAKLRRSRLDQREREIVIARKAAILEPGLPRVPVILPWWRRELHPIIRRRERLKLVFTPTSTDRLLAYAGTKGKGYQEIKAILDGAKKFMDVEVITNLNWRETTDRIKECDIRLDEVVTGGYGLATLEGLAAGCIVVGGCVPEILSFLPGGPPYIRATIGDLEQRLRSIAAMGHDQRRQIQEAGVAWVKSSYTEAWMHGCYAKVYADVAQTVGAGAPPSNAPAAPPNRAVNVVQPKVLEVRIDPEPFVENRPFRKHKSTGKVVVQIARTNCAGAIWRIHEAINRYTPHTCRTITAATTTNGRHYPRDLLYTDHTEIRKVLLEADVVHFHNWVDYESPEMVQYADILAGKHKIIQWHTEPSLIARAFRRDPVSRSDIPTLVIAQKHRRFYRQSIPVPNLVDIHDERLSPADQPKTGPLRVIYTPTDMKEYKDYTDTCCGKGFRDTNAILKKLESAGLIKAIIVTDMSWDRLMTIKRQCDVCIDECVTGGYHLCSLESLSQGLVTIAWIDPVTRQAINEITDDNGELPWVNSRIFELEATLRRLAGMPRTELNAIKDRGRKWMEKNWDPKVLVKHFMRAYHFADEGQNIVTVDAAWGENNRLAPIYDAPPRIGDDVLAIEGAWKNRSVVIWGNGPTVSQAVEQLPKLEHAAHIGVNMAAKLPVRFDAYCIGDLRFLQVPEKLHVALTAPGVKIYQSMLAGGLPPDLDVNYVRTIGREGFCSDLRRGVYHGYAVTWLALQVAVWAGSKDILLAGCPHNYTGKPRFYDETAPSPVDDNTERILANYRQVMPLLTRAGIRVRTIGPSRLAEAGVEQFKD